MPSEYLGQGLILTDVIFQNAGKAIQAPVIIDTGAMGFAAMDLPFAQKLGLSRTLSGMVSGVGGSTLAWEGTLDGMSIKDLPKCSVGQVSIGISDIPTIRNNAVALLGVNFMEETGLSVKFGKDTVQVGCDAAGTQTLKIPIKALSASGGGAGGGGDIFSDMSILGIAAAAIGGLLILGLIFMSAD